jgi:hypothetical protein
VPADLDRLPEQSSPVMPKDGSVTSDTPANAELLRVLVAEDDPVNSRIIQKRLEKLKHMVTLTGNGEECSGTYCDNTGDFDFVLMDMQVRCPYRDGRVRRSFWLMRETTDADCGWSDLDKDDPIL